VLSDHGQCLGATFRQRYGQPLEAIIAALLPGNMTVVGTTDSVESSGIGRRIAAELSRGPGPGSLLVRLLPGAMRPFGGGARKAASTAPDVVVASSGSLAHVYFMSQPDRMTDATIETHYPHVIEGLARHPGIGALVVRSTSGNALVLGPQGRLDLTANHLDGVDPLDAYGPRATESLLHLDGLSNVGDLILLGAIDPVSEEVTGFEELIGSHGGLGGWQGEPFILCPETLRLTEGLPVGAPAVYRQLKTWQAQLQGAHGD
jgi:hypothetical protein